MEIDLQENFREIERQVKRFGDQAAGEVLTLGVEAAAFVCADAARGTTAFRDRTGTLRGRIGVIFPGSDTLSRRRRASRSGRRRQFVSFGRGYRVTARAPHAHLVELGHGGKKPARAHPFLLPAALESRPLQIREAADLMLRTTRRIARRVERQGPRKRRR